jgi:MYXO-CTERM domain-containing protein
MMWLLALLAGPAIAADQAVLFVGNSYTQFNAPNAINEDYASLLAEGMPDWEVRSERYTRGGYTLSQHLSDAEGATDLHTYLTEGGADSWDLVVLQDQSQVPGFPVEQTEWIESKDAAVSLASMITAAGAEPRLFMTWGRRDGDSINVARFPDYPTMQRLLAEGYYAYAEAIVGAGYPVQVVPVGMAWQHIYDAHMAVGEDPLESSALFSRLYTGDGSHPSVLGSYLASLVFYGAFTGQSPEGLLWAPDAITEHDRDAVQAAAAAVMVEAIEPEDTDTGEQAESGDPDTSEPSGDSGDGEPSLTDEEISIEHAEPKEGCSCAVGGTAAPALLGWVLLALRRRQS